MSKCRVIKSAKYNGWPLRLVQYNDDGAYCVQETDEEGYWNEDSGDEFATEPEALQCFLQRATQLAQIPNWEAQAAYDDEHGTENGYAPWQAYQMEY